MVLAQRYDATVRVLSFEEARLTTGKVRGKESEKTVDLDQHPVVYQIPTQNGLLPPASNQPPRGCYNPCVNGSQRENQKQFATQGEPVRPFKKK